MSQPIRVEIKKPEAQRVSKAVLYGIGLHFVLGLGLAIWLWINPHTQKETPVVVSMGVAFVEEAAEELVASSEPISPPEQESLTPEVEEVPQELAPDPQGVIPEKKTVAPVKTSLSQMKPVSSASQVSKPLVDDMALPDLNRKPPPGASLTGAVRSIMSAYDARVKAVMDRMWQPPADLDLEEDARALVEIVVRRDGSRVRVALKESSGDRILDQKAMRLAQTAPLPALPGSYPYDEYTINYGYKYDME